MVKVCFLSPEYLPLSGGTGSYVYYLSNELMKLGNSAYIVTGYNENRDVEINYRHHIFFIKSLKAPVVKSFLFAAAASRKLNSIRGSFPVDIAHVNLPLVPSFAVPNDFGRTLVSCFSSMTVRSFFFCSDTITRLGFFFCSKPHFRQI